MPVTPFFIGAVKGVPVQLKVKDRLIRRLLGLNHFLKKGLAACFGQGDGIFFHEDLAFHYVGIAWPEKQSDVMLHSIGSLEKNLNTKGGPHHCYAIISRKTRKRTDGLSFESC